MKRDLYSWVVERDCGNRLEEYKSLSMWWAAKRTLNLKELQVEALEWTIGEEKKSPTKYGKEEQAYLRETLAKLRDSNEPLKAYSLWAK